MASSESHVPATHRDALYRADLLLRSTGPFAAARLRRRRRGRSTSGALCVSAHQRLGSDRTDQAHDISASAEWEFCACTARGVDRHQRHRIQLGLMTRLETARAEQQVENLL